MQIILTEEEYVKLTGGKERMERLEKMDREFQERVTRARKQMTQTLRSFAHFGAVTGIPGQPMVVQLPIEDIARIMEQFCDVVEGKQTEKKG